MPPTRLLDRVAPRYERLRGWGADIGEIREQAKLPGAARAYLKRIEETVGAPIGMVGVGPERSATLLS
jgi:adenylosuccinate synthase